MKKVTRLVCLIAVLILMGGCFGKKSEETNNTVSKQTEESPKIDKNTLTNDGEKTGTNESTDFKLNELANTGSEEKSTVGSDSSTSDKASKDPLDAYSNEQIEYARVWL